MRRCLPVLLLCCAVPAWAQLPSGTADYLARMDSNHDGRVDIDEYLAWMSYAFDARDADHNGVLEGAELPGSRGKPITRADNLARLRERFARQDRNHDGYLHARELAAPPQ